MRTEAGLSMGTIKVKTVTLASGLSLPFAETGDPAGTPVVFVHAWVESWRYFEPVLQHLPPRRCHPLSNCESPDELDL